MGLKTLPRSCGVFVRIQIEPRSLSALSILLRGHSTTSSTSSSSVDRATSTTPTRDSSSPSTPPPPPLSPSSSHSLSTPFSRAKHGSFFQPAPVLGNQFLDDPILSAFLSHHIPESMYSSSIQPDLQSFGDRVVDEILELHHQCEANPPLLRQFDGWGRRVDELITCDAWKKMKRISAEEGLVAIAYEKQFGRWSRLYQISKAYLFSPSSGLYSCPLSMTDGAALVIGSSANLSPGGADLSSAYKHLTSRQPDQFWTSGQWMTERAGGSDVGSGCETLAKRRPDGTFSLHGYKWFSSATDSDMAMTLARIVDEEGEIEPGSRGLSMFYLEVKNEDGSGLNNMEVVRLKNKLGTRQLPTAELLLDGAVAQLASVPGRGVASISPMLTVTRLHNSLMATSVMRRIVNVAKDYARRRIAFGKPLTDHPLHAQTLARMEVETRAATLFVLEVARHLGTLESADSQPISDAEKRDADLLLRILTPLMKLYTAKQSIACVSEGLECLGGQGYIEDTGYPGYLRDCQVLSIWEGTTNVLALDLLRAITKTRGKAVEAFFGQVTAKVEVAANGGGGGSGGGSAAMSQAAEALTDASKSVTQFLVEHQNDSSTLQVASRDLAYSMSRIFMGSLLVEFASFTGRALDAEVARRWCCSQELALVESHSRGKKAYGFDATRYDRDIALEGLDASL